MKRVSIRDVAKAAGVSITTVSKALNNYPDVNEQTKKRIQELVEKMNYVPDTAGRSMGGITQPMVGLLINNLMPTDPSGAVYSHLSGVCHVCKDYNIDFLLITTDLESQHQLSLKRLCLSKGLNGLVCSGFRPSDPYVSQMSEIDIPCVCIDLKAGAPSVLEVTIDNVRAADEAVSFLINSGKSEIAMLTGHPEIEVVYLRTKGYQDALARANQCLHPHRIIDADFNQELAYQKAKRLLLEDPAVDAFFCASDIMAFGVCHAIEDVGKRVGGDISVVGFDDIPIARYLYGGITTVRQDFYNMGYTAGRLICEKIIRDSSTVIEAKLLYELVVRGSAPGCVSRL